MSQRVRRRSIVQARLSNVLFQHSGDGARCQARSKLVRKQRDRRAFRDVDVSHFQPIRYSAKAKRPQRRDAFLFPFAQDVNNLLGFVDVVIRQRDQLSNADAGAVHRFENRPVANTGNGSFRRSHEKLINLFCRQKMRQSPVLTRISQRRRRVLVDDFFPLTEFEEASQRRQASRNS